MNDIDKMPPKCRDCPYWELAKFPWCCGDCKDRMKNPVSDFVSRQWLIDEYHRRHEGPPGGALKMIEDAPAADVEPVRHGKWVPGKEISRTMLGNEVLAIEYEDFYCSSCKRRYKEYVLIYKRCPECGAKMDKEG